MELTEKYPWLKNYQDKYLGKIELGPELILTDAIYRLMDKIDELLKR